MPFSSHLIHTCTIQANTPVQHDSGAETESWSAETTGQACRLVDGRSHRPMEDVGRQYQFDKTLLLPAGVTIDTERRVTDVKDGDGNTVDAGPYRVVEVNRRRRGSVHHIAARLEKVA